MDFKENTKDIIAEVVNAAKAELENYQDMPEHYSTMLKHPSIDAKGYYSEIDMDIAARLKKCDTYVQRRDSYQQAMYNYVRGEIETKADGLKKQVQEISKQHRVLTRAARLCEDEKAKEVLLHRAEALKESEAVKDYNLLITGLESYAGVGPAEMQYDTVLGFERLIGYVTKGETTYSKGFSDGIYSQRPEQIKIEMRNMDQLMEQIMLSHPGIKEKSEEECKNLRPSYEMFTKAVDKYAKDSCEDTLSSCFATMDERLDLLIINGQTLRELIEEKEGVKERTKEELQELSCNYLTGALRNGERVEAFMPEAQSPSTKKYYGETVPFVSTEPKERITLSFWEVWLSKLGFFKEKVKRFEEQQKMDQKMEACRKRVKEKMTKDLSREEKAAGKKMISFSEPMTKEQKERLQIGNEVAKETMESFIKEVRAMEKTDGERNRLLYSFFPEELKEGKAVVIDGCTAASRLVRDMPLYYAVAFMLQEGIPYEEILDPTKHIEKRIEIGNKLKEIIPTMGADEFDRLHIDCLRTLSGVVDKFAEKMSREIKTPKDITEKYSQLVMGILAPYTMSMDDFNNKERAIAYCGGQKEFDALIGKAEEPKTIYTMFTQQKSVLQSYYQVLRGGRNINIDLSLRDTLRRTAIVQALHAKEPGFAPKMSLDDYLTLDTVLLAEHPEKKNMQEKADRMDKKFLKNWLNNGVKMKLEILEKEATNKTSIGGFNPGELSLSANVVINGKKMTELDAPVIEDEMCK